MDHSPNMKQYVGLLELICASSSIPTAEMLQDVSVLYARLGRNMKIASLLFHRLRHRYTVCPIGLHLNYSFVQSQGRQK